MTFLWKNAPTSYQGWHNTQYGRKNTDSFIKRHVRHTADSLAVFQYTRICRFYPEPSKCFTEESDEHFRNIQDGLLHQLQPSYLHNRTCTMVLLYNLAKPDWVSIHCHQKILSHVVCFKRNTTIDSVWKLDVSFQHCHNRTILNNDTCFRIRHTELNKMYQCKIMNSEHKNSVALFKMIISATSLVHLDIVYLLPEDNMLEFGKLTKSLLTITITNTLAAGGLCAEESTPVFNLTSGIVLHCESGEYISSFFYNPNEQNCVKNGINTSNTYQQQNSYPGFEIDKQCSPLHYKEHDGTCKTFRQQQIGGVSEKVILFDCSSGLTIHKDLIDDLVSDCGQQPDDEPLYISLLVNQTFQSCKNPLQIPCFGGHSKCYEIVDVCVYRLNHQNHITPCRTGAHMQNCTSFECNGQLKCPLFYCIPLAYICDGKWDCPCASDEVYTECALESNCAQKFKCRNSKICIHVHDICDGHSDCPQKDDELLCELKDVLCLEKCYCLHFAILCNNVTVRTGDVLFLPYVSYTFTSCKLEWAAIQSLLLNRLILRVNFSDNQLAEIPSLLLLKSVVAIDFSTNNLSIIPQYSLKSITKLRYILLSHNQILYIEGRAFDQLGCLSVLDLDNNRLSQLFVEAYQNVESIFLLKVSGNDFSGAQMNLTKELNSNVKAVSTNDILICCFLESAKCFGEITWYKSCNDLLYNLSTSFLFLTISLCCVTLNTAMVLLGNLVSHQTKIKNLNKKTTSFDSIISSIGVGHILHCAYLVTIGSAHVIFLNIFFMKDKLWLRSPLCATAFASELSFSLLVSCLYSFLSLARTDITVNLFGSHFKDHTFVVKSFYFSVTFSHQVFPSQHSPCRVKGV